jgi:hypothetical protein
MGEPIQFHDLQRAPGLREDCGFLATVESEHSGDHAGAALGIGAESHILEHRSLRHDPHGLERAGNTAVHQIRYPRRRRRPHEQNTALGRFEETRC